MPMRPFILILIFYMASGQSFAQSVEQEPALPPLAPSPKELPHKEQAPKEESPKEESKDGPATSTAPKGGKDLTVRSEEDRVKMLAELFVRLKSETEEEDAVLIAEEVWAVFLQSGSASVDYLLHRGIAAQNRGDNKLARRMYDHVLRLQPNYAEGWSRSGRLAADEEDLNRAVSDTTQALILEPRHFYALWTLGNILETLERPDDAFEVYEEANKIYPTHKQIKERVERLKESAKGKAL